jgi:SAM-dependent methyltransferase
MLTDTRTIAVAAAHDPACRLCGAGLGAVVLDLGRLPRADRLTPADIAAPSCDLRVRLCESCLLVQTEHAAPPADPAGRLRSVPSTACVEHARRLAATLSQRLDLGPASLVIGVGAGDGVFLRPFHDAGVPVLGVEPAEALAQAARAAGIRTETSGFNAETAMPIAVRHGRADLVLAQNVLPKVADLFDFAAGFASVLRPKGIVVFQFPWLLPMLQRARLDAVRHDRPNYLSLLVLERVLRPAGLRAFDAERLADHGGSLRVYCCHPRAPHAVRPGLKAVRQAESQARLDHPDGYAGFARSVAAVRRDVRDFLRIRRAAGRTVAAYGACARGIMLLNACGISAEDVACAADPDPAHRGYYLPGSGIPVIAPDELYARRPHDVLILPWPNAAEIAASLLPLRQKGTQFWVADPAVRRV